MNTHNQTIEQLEGKNLALPKQDDVSYLVWRISNLRKQPLHEFDTEDLRVMIGQNEGLPWLIPMAIEILKKHPFAEGDYYPGDLLNSVLTCNKAYWQGNPAEKEIIVALFPQIDEQAETAGIAKSIKQSIAEAIKEF